MLFPVLFSNDQFVDRQFADAEFFDASAADGEAADGDGSNGQRTDSAGSHGEGKKREAGLDGRFLFSQQVHTEIVRPPCRALLNRVIAAHLFKKYCGL